MKRLAPLLLACATCIATAQPIPSRDAERVANALRERLRAGLRDPDSALFRNETLSLSQDTDNVAISLCGEVNAKNAYGGYTGFQAFIINREGILMIDGSEPRSAIPYAWPVWCAKEIWSRPAPISKKR